MRESGILLPVTALPSRHGIGKLGQAAYDFVDFLRGAGCHYWQVLPLSPTGYGDSPYQSCSCFAGNPYLIDFDRLAACGWLNAADYEGIQWDESAETIEYTLLYEQIMPVLRIAFHNFRKKKPAAFRKFCSQQKAWLGDYAAFMALKDLNGSRPWYEWEPALARCDKTAVAEAKKKLAEDIEFHSFVQFLSLIHI